MNKTVNAWQLVDRLKQGEAAAVREWFFAYKPVLERYISSKVSSLADVEELVQETFLNSLRQIAFFRGDSQLETWMLSIARHEIADYYRKKYAKKALRYLPLSEFLFALQVDDSSEVSRQVRAVLNTMSERSRELLLSKYIDGKKVPELAAEFGKTVKAIESELFRAREEFKVLWLAQT